MYLEGTLIPWRKESEGISVKRNESGLEISRGSIQSLGKLPVGARNLRARMQSPVG